MLALLLSTALAGPPTLVSSADAWRVVRVRAAPIADADGGGELGGDLEVTSDADGDGEPELWIAAPRADSHVQDSGYVTRIPASALRDAVDGVVDEGRYDTVWGPGVGFGVFGGRLRRAARHVPRPFEPSACVGAVCVDDDLDGDGRSDLLLAVRGGLGQALLVPGRAAPWGPDQAASGAVSTLEAGATLGTRFGQALTLCDLDGDGVGEPYVTDSRMAGDPCGTPLGAEAGAVFRWVAPDPRPGSLVRVCTEAAPLVASGAPGDRFGQEITCLHGPGGDQLVATSMVVSCPAATCATRTIYAVAWDAPPAPGLAASAPRRAELTVPRADRNDMLVVGTATDLDQDGQDDLLLGAPDWTCPGICEGAACGAVAVHLGGLSPGTVHAVDDADVVICGARDRRTLGRTLAAGGDVNGDGRADWVVGDADEDNRDLPTHVYVIYGGALDGLTGAVSVDAVASHRFHVEVDGVPDVDNLFGRRVELTDLDLDGYADVLMGARGLDDESTPGVTNRGGAFVAFGAPDRDRDGWFGAGAGGDCDDGDPGVRPDLRPCVPEAPVDADGDGFAAGLGDCDDADPSVHPGAEELPDGINQDCDRRIDEGTVAYDDDGDGASELAGDCDDADPARAPGLLDPCDGVDQDCDGLVDEDGWQRWYADADADGHGAAEGIVDACGAPDGYVARGGDCDDGDATRHPGATERAWDGVDQDCDGQDFVDVDGDGYAGGDGPDCDDGDPLRYPGSTARRWDTADLDCDGRPDRVRVGWCATGPARPGGALLALWIVLVSAAGRGRSSARR